MPRRLFRGNSFCYYDRERKTKPNTQSKRIVFDVKKYPCFIRKYTIPYLKIYLSKDMLNLWKRGFCDSFVVAGKVVLHILTSATFRSIWSPLRDKEEKQKMSFKILSKTLFSDSGCFFLCHSHMLASGAKKSKKCKTVSVGHKLPFAIHILFIFEYTSKSFWSIRKYCCKTILLWNIIRAITSSSLKRLSKVR